MNVSEIELARLVADRQREVRRAVAASQGAIVPTRALRDQLAVGLVRLALRLSPAATQAGVVARPGLGPGARPVAGI